MAVPPDSVFCLWFCEEILREKILADALRFGQEIGCRMFQRRRSLARYVLSPPLPRGALNYRGRFDKAELFSLMRPDGRR
jgi:hypothetical protein